MQTNTIRRSSDRQSRNLALIGFIALAFLNGLDMLLTRAVLGKVGVGAEQNVLARWLLADYRVDILKAIVLVGIAISVFTRRVPSVTWLSILWAAVGIYAMTVAVNFFAWRSIA